MSAELASHLLNLRRELLEMAAVVDERAIVILQALERNDFSRAHEIVHGDREVDKREISIEEHCIELLALHAPVAGDLRVVIASLRMITELERVGDLAKSTAKRIVHLDEHGFLTLPEVIGRMAAAVRGMLRQTLDALQNNDADTARAVRRNDKQVDEFQRIILDWAQSEIAQGRSLASEGAVDLMSIARNLERMGDMCTNIAEEIIFAVEGEIVRHTRA